MREALATLGFGPCHHMREIFLNPEQKKMWWRAVATGASPNWSQLFRGYNSCVDWPSAFCWRELIEAYPDAKVLLTYRSPESWWASFEKRLLVIIRSTTERESLDIALVAEQVFGGRPDDRAHAIAVYREYVEAVLATVPADRLLVHRLGDGWQTLCNHLGVDRPADPYPCRNTGDEFRAVLQRGKTVTGDPPASATAP
jgi:hypothetical protein